MKDEKYCLTKIGEKIEEHGDWHVYWSDFGHNDPLAEFAPEPMQETEEVKKSHKVNVHKVKSEKEKKEEEFSRLATLHFDKKHKFERANRIRWILTFIGFAIFYFAIIFAIYDYKTPVAIVDEYGIITKLRPNVEHIAIMVGTSLVAAGFHFLINLSIFGWLIQKTIASDRRLDAIRKQMDDVEESLNKGGGDKHN